MFLILQGTREPRRHLKKERKADGEVTNQQDSTDRRGKTTHIFWHPLPLRDST